MQNRLTFSNNRLVNAICGGTLDLTRLINSTIMFTVNVVTVLDPEQQRTNYKKYKNYIAGFILVIMLNYRLGFCRYFR